MSVGIDYPVFRTPDLVLALNTARRMVAFGVQPYSEVSVEAELPTLAETTRMRDALPEAWFMSWTAPFDPGAGIPDLARGFPPGSFPTT
ncbi:hypothetical protein OH809_04265 [Streptomyces sp. NBC_00873]|uniref:hypothetical protein n=1 Tax=unclassified Streptomyces TaxID=2593676 RepID=UPI003864A875|nr:hypothetical protein OH809_04265 [Streptomyces sp. NBC_00873]WTA47928.1 hypothetical protein OH821_39535 [Streptomyces sp. NBC_00842]